jgi:hypothetical protein
MSSKDIPPGGLPTPGHPLELSSSMGPSQGACYWGFQEKRWLCHREPSGLAVWTISRVVERSHSCSKVTDRPTLSHGPSVLPQRALPRGSPLVFGSKLELTNFLVTPLGKRVYRCTKNQPPKWPVQNIAPMFLQATSWSRIWRTYELKTSSALRTTQDNWEKRCCEREIKKSRRQRRSTWRTSRWTALEGHPTKGIWHVISSTYRTCLWCK